jgi:hypothetical protein
MLLLPEFRWARREGRGCGDNEERRRLFLYEYRGSSCSLQAGEGFREGTVQINHTA